MGRCTICRDSSTLIADELGLCLDCIRQHSHQALGVAAEVHGRIRREWGVPATAPESRDGIQCDICMNRCRMADGQWGYCGLRQNVGDRIVGVSERWRRPMLDSALESGDCIKIDLKAWDENFHLALIGVSSRQTLDNFKWFAERAAVRKQPPLLIASTLLVPGYIDAREVFQIAKFIASLNPDIPYSLLGFHPDPHMMDLAATSKQQAKECLDAARQAGVLRINVGNMHLLW